MRLRLRQRFELLGIRFVERRVHDTSAGLRLPVFHRLLGRDYFHLLPLEFQKAHKPAETFLVNTAYRNLIRMVACWAKELPSGAASGNARVISLGRLGGDDLLFVELGPEVAKSIPLQESGVEADWTILQLAKGMRRVLGCDPCNVPFGLLQKHPGRSEKRIRLGALSDLPGNVRGSVGFRNKVDSDFCGKSVGLWPRSPLVGALVVRPVPLVATRSPLRSCARSASRALRSVASGPGGPA